MTIAVLGGGAFGIALALTLSRDGTEVALWSRDVDDANIESATVRITGNYQNGQDILDFADLGPITGSWNAATGTMTLSGSDTLANYQAALRTVTYRNTSEDPSTLVRTVSFTVNDGDVNSNTVTRDINLTPTNDGVDWRRTSVNVGRSCPRVTCGNFKAISARSSRRYQKRRELIATSLRVK